ncbi:Zn-dependent hydrolase [Gemmatimonadota bacterium]
MSIRNRHPWILILVVPLIVGCQSRGGEGEDVMSIRDRLEQYTTFRLTTDLSVLSDDQREMIPLLIRAAEEMDEIFWMQAWGDKEEVLQDADRPTREYLGINYGPWDRIEDDEPFLEGFGVKSPGANFYPEDITKEELEAAAESDPALKSLYTIVRRKTDGTLEAVPYHIAFGAHVERAVELLRAAARLADDPGFKRYLELRADAFLTDDYQESDFAWMEMKDNLIDLVIGPIETYEDQLFGAKAAHECFVLIKDMEWSLRLARYATLLPELQRRLPVPDRYRQETPGSDSDLNAYDAIYYSGDANAGSKTIAINLPNDPVVQLEKGARRLQLKNAMQAKFDMILKPIVDVVITPDQRSHVTFDAFFSNTMFHEVAHGLGIKNTLTGQGTVREALSDLASSIEEGKADILGLYAITKLAEMGELGDVDLMDNYVTFIAGIFRSIRFGSSSAHGRANLARFSYFLRAGAFTRDETTATWRVDLERAKQATEDLARAILTMQGDGDYEAAAAFMAEYAVQDAQLAEDLDRIDQAGIPTDIVFEQGLRVLGLGR